jgi:hypothetical protein
MMKVLTGPWISLQVSAISETPCGVGFSLRSVAAVMVRKAQGEHCEDGPAADLVLIEPGGGLAGLE